MKENMLLIMSEKEINTLIEGLNLAIEKMKECEEDKNKETYSDIEKMVKKFNYIKEEFYENVE